MARSHALFIEGLADVATEVITEAALAEVLGGAPLDEAIGATFVLQVGAYENAGAYDGSWLDQENFKEVLAFYPRNNIEVAVRRLTTTTEEFQADFATYSHGNRVLAKFDYNPLVRTPFIELENGTIVAPAARLIMRTVTPGGLYYPGIARFGNPFAEDMGRLFEHYVGRNLRLIEGAEVHAEIAYGRRRENKSVDWFVVLPGLVLLVECKLKRLPLSARSGDSALLNQLDLVVGKAHRQLQRTLECLATKVADFKHIPTGRPADRPTDRPTGRPIVAMVVSASASGCTVTPERSEMRLLMYFMRLGPLSGVGPISSAMCVRSIRMGQRGSAGRVRSRRSS